MSPPPSGRRTPTSPQSPPPRRRGRSSTSCVTLTTAGRSAPGSGRRARSDRPIGTKTTQDSANQERAAPRRGCLRQSESRTTGWLRPQRRHTRHTLRLRPLRSACEEAEETATLWTKPSRRFDSAPLSCQSPCGPSHSGACVFPQVIQTCCYDDADSFHFSLPVTAETQSEEWDSPVQVSERSS